MSYRVLCRLRAAFGSAVVAAIMVACSVAGGALPVAAAERSEPDLEVTITALTPATLVAGQPVVLSGRVRNDNNFTWSQLQAYLVIPRSPFTSRAQVSRAISGGGSYTGERIVDLPTIDELGDLAAGESTTFSVTVPWETLGITGAEGVYPVGIQLLGSRPDGERTSTAVGRATTFVPFINADRPAVPAAVVWPFVMPLTITSAGTWANPSRLVDDVSDGGRLRNLLDLANASPAEASTVLIDPALLDGLADLSQNRKVAKNQRLDDDQLAAVERFLTDLVDLTRRGATWITGYGLPDQLAVSTDGDRGQRLAAALDRATESVISDSGIPGLRTNWLLRGGMDEFTVTRLRGETGQPVIVQASAVPRWVSRDGSMVTLPTAAGPAPLLVTDDLSVGLPGADSAVTLRQRLLTEAALASLQRSIDPESRADAVTVVPPQWDPGAAWRSADFEAAWQLPWLRKVTLDDLLISGVRSADSRLERGAEDPLPYGLLAAADELLSASASLDALSAAPDAADDSSRLVASVLSLQWRQTPTEASDVAAANTSRIHEQLQAVAIEGPPSFILSGTQGRVPLTISNDTSRPIKVGVRIDSTNPELVVPAIKPVEIAAGERNTVDVVVDVGNQNTSTLSARLVTADGTVVGTPAEFNVRSSKVGVYVWIAMAFAGVLLVAAVTRRLIGRRRG